MSEREEHEFVSEHEPLVRSIATRIRAELQLNVELEDLIAYGYTGLLQARERFEPSRGVRFTTFAYYRVRGAILDGVRTMARLPRRVHAARKAAEALDMVAEAAGQARASAPTPPDLGATLGAMDEILGKYSAAFMIAAVGQQEDEGAEPESLAIAGEDRERVSAAIEALPERERLVITGHYFQDRTLEEIGASLGISKSWCSRLHSRALGLLRTYLQDLE